MSATATARPSYADASRTLLRETVLDAVGELLGDRVWADVSMGEVAKQAGVSRQTLYNVFGSRQELSQAYVMREADRFLGAVEETIRSNREDPKAALAIALEIFLSIAETHPLARAITSGGGDELLPLVTTRGAPVLDRVIEELARLIADTWSGVRLADARLLADCLVRLAISHAALPSAPPAQTAATITRILGPYIDQALEQPRVGEPSKSVAG